MIDQATNGDGDSGRFKILNDWEHDDPAQAPTFKRDQHLTPVEQLRAKVVRMLQDEISGYEEDFAWDSRMSELARKVEGMAL